MGGCPGAGIGAPPRGAWPGIGGTCPAALDEGGLETGGICCGAAGRGGIIG